MKHLILAGSLLFLISTAAVAGPAQENTLDLDEAFPTNWNEDSLPTVGTLEVSEFSAMETGTPSVYIREINLEYDEAFSSITTPYK